MLQILLLLEGDGHVEHRASNLLKPGVPEAKEQEKKVGDDAKQATISFHGQEYQVGPLIGQGNYGTVHLVTNHNGQKFALKTMTRGVAGYTTETHPEVLALKAMMKKCNGGLGPILCFVDAKIEHDTLYLLTEWLEGYQTMEQFGLAIIDGKQNPLSVQDATRVIVQLVTVIQSLHDEGWAHNDATFHNFMIRSSDLHVKLIDLGIANHEKENHDRKILSRYIRDWICVWLGPHWEKQCSVLVQEVPPSIREFLQWEDADAVCRQAQVSPNLGRYLSRVAGT